MYFCARMGIVSRKRLIPAAYSLTVRAAAGMTRVEVYRMIGGCFPALQRSCISAYKIPGQPANRSAVTLLSTGGKQYVWYRRIHRQKQFD